MITLYPPQAESAQKLTQALRHYGAALDSSETGTGKTYVAIEVAKSLGLEPLVVCPKVVVPAWEAAFEAQGHRALGILNYEKLRTGRTPYGQWSDKKKTTFQWTPAPQMVILDECHYAKGHNTQNAKIAFACKGTPTLMLSATAAQDPTEMKALGYLLGLHNLKDYTLWAKLHGCSFNEWHALEFDVGLAQHFLDKLNQEIYQTTSTVPARASQITRNDLRAHFPGTIVSTEPLDFGDAGGIEKIYNFMQKELAELEDRKQYDERGSEGLTLQLRARQEVELLKVPVFVELTLEALREGFSVATFLCFSASIDAYTRLLPGPVPRIQGGQSEQSRAEAIAAFQSGNARVLVANISAGGVGVSLHDLHGDRPRLALISPSWDVKQLLQVLGRVDRAGGQSVSYQRILFAPVKIETTIRDALRTKLSNLRTLHMTPGSTDNLTPSPFHADEVDPFPPRYNFVGGAWVRIAPSPLHADDPAQVLYVGLSREIAKDRSEILDQWQRLSPVRCDHATHELIIHVPLEVPTTANLEDRGTKTFFTRRIRKLAQRHELQAPDKWGVRFERSFPGDPSAEENDDPAPKVRPVAAPTSPAIDNAHAHFSPSSLRYFEICPSYQKTSGTSAAAEAGTRVHEAVEKDDVTIGANIEEQHYAQALIDMRHQIGARHFAGETEVEDLRERRYDVRAHDEITFGTVDQTYVCRNQAVLIDYKYGLGEVDDAEINIQMACYGVGVFQEFPEVDTIHVYIVLPRQDLITTTTYLRSEHLRLMVGRIHTVIKRAVELAGKEFNPVPGVCDYCARKLRCQAWLDISLLVARNVAPEQFALPSSLKPDDLDDPAVVANVLRVAKMLEGWIAEAKTRARVMAFDEGFDLPGFRKIFSKPARRLSNGSAVWEAIRQSEEFPEGLTLDEFLPTIGSVSITDLEEVICTKVTPHQKEDAKTKLEDRLLDVGALQHCDELIGKLYPIKLVVDDE